MQYLPDDLVIFYWSMIAILASAFLSDFFFIRFLIKREAIPSADAKREVDPASAGSLAFGALIAMFILMLLASSSYASFAPIYGGSNPLGVPLFAVAVILSSYCGGRLAYATTRLGMNENPFVLDDSENEPFEHT